ncbi:MAG: hypothetical protein R3F65_23775, partial [bacterium]
MTTRHRSKTPPPLADWVCLVDEAADPNERINALVRLRRAGHLDRLWPVADEWLSHPTPLLRAEALSLLMIWARRPTDHLSRVFNVLHHDPSWWVRADAGRLLVDPLRGIVEERDLILRHVVQQLEVDEDEDTQMSLYESLLAAIIPDRDKRPRL